MVLRITEKNKAGRGGGKGGTRKDSCQGGGLTEVGDISLKKERERE